MLSFQTELENSLVEKDIIDLEKKIRQFHEGTIDPEKFRSLRLARGVYGQRQQGVQMVRIKLPFGKMTTQQLKRIADISDEYSNGNLHLTTRQDIQIHYVILDRTPELWAKLEQDDITLREACGNTVRNVTASAEAGIDPKEPFDVSPYAKAVFEFFLRKPFGQELGRKFKISFSSNDEDNAFSYIHDIGFIPKVKIINGSLKRGFKVLIGGGLGAQPYLAQTAFEFLEEDRIIPFIESTIRVFDRHGERNNRHKARFKYLLGQIGIVKFMELIDEERATLEFTEISIKKDPYTSAGFPVQKNANSFKTAGDPVYGEWLQTNVFEQKQKGYFGVYVKVQLGNIHSSVSRKLADVAERYAANDVRITVNQGLLLKFVRKDSLTVLYEELKTLGLSASGFNSTLDITACPGTDTCNLGITSSTGITKVLEKVLAEEYPELAYERNLSIKISGCMNSCGQHGLAQIGFHGSSIKNGNSVVPALQLSLGGGTLGDGKGRIGEKIIKFPAKRGPAVVRALLDDFHTNASEDEYFNSYYDRVGKDHFYRLLKPYADTNISIDELIDWGQEEKFKPLIGVGECAGVQIDLVQTLFFEADEKLLFARESFDAGAYADGIYHAYSAFVHASKGSLLTKGFHANAQSQVIHEFEKQFILSGEVSFAGSFSEIVLGINKNKPTHEFASAYINASEQFLSEIKNYHSTINEIQKVLS